MLSEREIEGRLSRLPGWERSGKEISRQYELDNFKGAIAFVNRVAEFAEEANHHPDMLIQYRRVKLTLTSHDAGGLTERDFDLAARIDGFPTD